MYSISLFPNLADLCIYFPQMFQENYCILILLYSDS